jgi:hypothetical protein
MRWRIPNPQHFQGPERQADFQGADKRKPRLSEVFQTVSL